MQMHVDITTEKKQQIIDITNEARHIVEKSDIEEGICLVYVPHATCAIIINENYDADVCEDILTALNKIVPEQGSYKHNKKDSNAAAHIKSALLSPCKSIPIHNGILQLGEWQGIGLVELDGPRERTVIISLSSS